ncbi:MAG: DUF445 family protein [Candidatus Electrothrix sp. AR4]|nr:DUF445 family protein [Candidatus Electrothrix sp. AR4]
MFLSTAQMLTYGGPPLLGALIGYLTNKVAIRMLFRPLVPWYILGKRVPMTPGIIPSKRHDLAENIGEMVGEQLLTSTDIGAALSAERFQGHLRQLVDDRVADVLSRDLGPFQTVVPRRFRAYARIGLRTLKYQMRSGVRGYIDAPDFTGMLGAILPRQLETIGGRTLNELLQAEDRQGLYDSVETFLGLLLNDPKNADRLGKRLEKTLTEAAVAGKSIEDLLPEELVELFCSTVEKQVPEVLSQVAVMLSEPTMRDHIVLAVKGGLESFIDGLGPMAAMAKGFIDMNTLDDTIRIWLEEKEGALADWFQKPEIEEQVRQTLTGQARTFFETPLANVLVKVEPEKVREICQQVAVRIMTALNSDEMRGNISGMFKEQLENMIEHGQVSLAEFAEMVLKKKPMGRMRRTLANELRTMLQSEETRGLLDKMVNSMVDQVASKPLGMLQDLMPAGVRNGITEYILLTADRMLIREVPGLVRSLNIKQLVTEKVDSLDLMRLERLLLSIMEEQFKYINLFGALLGFLIGCINLVVILAG